VYEDPQEIESSGIGSSKTQKKSNRRTIKRNAAAKDRTSITVVKNRNTLEGRQKAMSRLNGSVEYAPYVYLEDQDNSPKGHKRAELK
jgi:uncharacterized protein (DUF927 family)